MFSHDIFILLHVKIVHDVIWVDFQTFFTYQKHNKLFCNMILQTKMPNDFLQARSIVITIQFWYLIKFKFSIFVIQYFTQILAMHHCKNASVHLQNHALSIKHFVNVSRLTKQNTVSFPHIIFIKIAVSFRNIVLIKQNEFSR